MFVPITRSLRVPNNRSHKLFLFPRPFSFDFRRASISSSIGSNKPLLVGGRRSTQLLACVTTSIRNLSVTGGARYILNSWSNQLAGSVRKLSSNGKPEGQTFLQRFLGPKPMPPRWTFRWYGEMVLLCTVFAITGSSTMILVRPAMSEVLGLKGSLKDGPWSYRICSLVIMTPLYASLLVVVGTIFGRHFYFKHFAVKMFSRFGIPPELMDANFRHTKKNFRKY